MAIEDTLVRIAVALEGANAINKVALELLKARVARDMAERPTPEQDASAETPTKPKRGKSAASLALPKESTPSSTEETAPASGGESADDWGDEPAKEPAAKETSIEDVRAALTAVQTKKGHKDHALAVLEKVSGGKVLSGLKKEDYAKLVAACNAALK